MREGYEALKKLREDLGIKVSAVAQGVSLPAEALEHTRRPAQGRDPSGGGEQPRGAPRGAAAKKKKTTKKKK
jgi:hypothetical protein